MARQPNEDLFEHSRMSFGQHLEELRKVLFRSMIGLGVACIFGFIYSPQVVEFLKNPLTDAVDKYVSKNAAVRIKDKEGFVGPEVSPLLESGVVPREVMVNPAKFRRMLGLESLVTNPSGITAEHIKADRVAELAKQMMAEGDQAEPKLLAMWKSLSAVDQSTLQRMSELAGSASSVQRSEVAEVLDRLSKSKSLSDDPAFAKRLSNESGGFLSLLSEPKENPLADMKAALAENTSDTLVQRLNRALIFESLDDHLEPNQLELVPFEFWEKIDSEPIALTFTEPFFIWFKTSLIFSLTIAAPWIFYQIWSFVAAGLYPHEQKYIYIFMPFSLLLFLAGACLAYFYVFGPVLSFLLSFNSMMGIAIEPRINDWISFVMMLPLGFGIAFQLPLVMLFLNRIGLFGVQDYLTKWRIAVMIIFVLSMVLTPADPISMILLACPLTALYFLGIALCAWLPKAQNPYSDVIESA